MTKETREAKPAPKAGVWSFRSFLRAVMAAFVAAFVGAFAGAFAGIGIGLGAVLTLPYYSGGDVEFPAYVAVPLSCAICGFFQGVLGALSGTWRRGLLIGVVISGLLSVAVAWNPTPSENVWAVVAVWMIAGAAAGAVGGVVRQRLGTEDQLLRAVLRAAVGAFAGAVAALGVGILGALAEVMADGSPAAIVKSWEAGEIFGPFACAAHQGLLVGALGALSGTWRRGLFIGVVLSSLFCWGLLSDVRNTPPSVVVWVVTVLMIAGPAAGAAGGVVRQSLDKKSQTAEA